MKKTLTLLVFVAIVSFTHGQTMVLDRPIKPFHHLSTAIEIGTFGVGLQIATPLNERFGLRAGYVFTPTFTPKVTIDYNINDRDRMNDIINNPEYRKVKEELLQKSLPTNAYDLPESTDVKSDIGLSNGKVLLDFYPIRGHSFHITAGIYFGNNKVVRANGGIPVVIADVDAVLDKYASEYGYSYDNTIMFGSTSFEPNELKNIRLDGQFNSVKPYFGIGFGRLVPTRRIGVQVEIGAMYLGKMEIVANTQKLTDAIYNELKAKDNEKYLSYASIYPMISFKLVGKLF